MNTRNVCIDSRKFGIVTAAGVLLVPMWAFGYILVEVVDAISRGVNGWLEWALFIASVFWIWITFVAARFITPLAAKMIQFVTESEDTVHAEMVEHAEEGDPPTPSLDEVFEHLGAALEAGAWLQGLKMDEGDWADWFNGPRNKFRAADDFYHQHRSPGAEVSDV